MKKRFLLLTLIMCLLGGVNSLSLKAQDDPNVVTIDGTTTNYESNVNRSIPFDAWCGSSISQQIYLSSEIEHAAGTIESISFHIGEGDGTDVGDYPYEKCNISVYMRNIDYDNFSSTTSLIMDESELVYTGYVSFKLDDWSTIELTEKFTYTGGNILLCVWEDNDPDYTDGINYFKVLDTGDDSNRTMYKKSSGVMIINTPVTNTHDDCFLSDYVPQIKLTFANTGNDTPTAPTVVTPTDGTTISGTTVNLRWSYGADNTATHYQVSLGTDNENLYPISGNEQNRWEARTVLGTDGFATEDEFPNVNLEYGTTYYWRVDVRNGEGDPVGGAVWSFATPASAAFEFITEGDWNVGANWNGGAVPGNGAVVVLNANATINAGDNINVADLEIEDGSLTINGSLTITGEFSNTDASKLVINDGGQIFQTNEGVKATFNMNINNPTVWSENNIDGWQLISSPFTDASIDNFVTTGDGNDYDLYKFDGKQVGAEWQNQKAIATFEEEFVSSRGYLASYKKAATASITGTLNNATYLYLDKNDENNKITVTVGGNMHNFFLIGNPFPFDIDMSKMEYMQYLIEGYAILDNNGGNFQYVGTTGTIKAGDAFLIKTTGVANNNNPILYYSHTPSKSRSENHNSINLIATGAEGSDNLIISLSGAENEGFNKLENFNKDIATVFVVKNDIRYGIANFDNDVTMIDVAFEATKMGNYTISAQPEGKFETVTLVDRFTGIETNLLVEDYHFTAMSEENNNRFFIRLGNSQESTDNSHFAYVSGEDLIIEAEGTVQIIDMMGRVVYTSNVENNNRINVSDFNNGAYVVRVINENEVKVEKVVIY